MPQRNFIHTLTALLQAMRPLQWVKNGVLFAALVFDRQLGLTHLPALARTAAGFAIFCLLSGVVYIINDIADVEQDRLHPEKRRRPIASGRLPVPVAVIAAAALLVVLLPVSYVLSPAFAVVALIYFLQNLAYSKWIKHLAILDVFSIAAGFVLRVAAGVTLIHVERFSPWLYVVTMLGSLYIGFGKRRAELAQMAGSGSNTRKVLSGYSLPMLDQYITIVSSTTVIAYSLYTFLAPNVPENHAMMLTIPFVIYGIFRYLYLVQMHGRGGAPEEILIHDRPLQATVLIWGLTVLVIFYFY
ncbi:MAG: decaprenyl-phosphate phosphoribosyltransferase [Chloroflexota bacterium]